MQPRLSNPAQLIPSAMKPIMALFNATKQGGAPEDLLELVHLRVSQINGCSACVDSGARSARKAGESEDRLFAVAAWREAPVLQRGRTLRARPSRGGHPARRPPRPGTGRGMGRGRQVPR